MLSDKAKKSLEIALASRALGEEVSSAIDSGSNEQAAAVAELGATSDFTLDAPVAVDLNAVFSDTEVESALDAKADQAAVNSLMADMESRLDAAEAKIDELLQALKTASLMAE